VRQRLSASRIFLFTIEKWIGVLCNAVSDPRFSVECAFLDPDQQSQNAKQNLQVNNYPSFPAVAIICSPRSVHFFVFPWIQVSLPLAIMNGSSQPAKNQRK
jgi:hypothetical protein